MNLLNRFYFLNFTSQILLSKGIWNIVLDIDFNTKKKNAHKVCDICLSF